MFYKKIPYLRYCYKMTLGILNGLSVFLSFPLSLVCCMGGCRPPAPPANHPLSTYPHRLESVVCRLLSVVTTEEIPGGYIPSKHHQIDARLLKMLTNSYLNKPFLHTIPKQRGYSQEP